MRELKKFKTVSLNGRDYFEGVVYCYTNKINGKIHIGQTIWEERRKREHKRLYKSSSPCNFNKIFYIAIRKYGYDNMKCSVLCRVLSSSSESLTALLNVEETKYIELLNSKDNGYNTIYGGGGTVRGIKSQEERDKISQELRNEREERVMRDRSVENSTSAIYIYQYTLDGEFVQKFKSSKTGEKLTGIPAAWILNCIAESSRKSDGGFVWRLVGETPEYTASESNSSKKVEQYTLENIFIREFESVREAARFINCGNSNTANCCNGIYSQSHCYVWKFKI